MVEVEGGVGWGVEEGGGGGGEIAVSFLPIFFSSLFRPLRLITGDTNPISPLLVTALTGFCVLIPPTAPPTPCVVTHTHTHTRV